MGMMKRYAEQVSEEMGFDGELNDQVLTEADRRLKAGQVPKCPGCGRSEVHKMCPAWGTPLYMTGQVFTEEDEKKYAKERQAAIEASRCQDSSSGK